MLKFKGQDDRGLLELEFKDVKQKVGKQNNARNINKGLVRKNNI